MRGNRASWTVLALAGVFASAFACLVAALFVPGLHLFAAFAAASVGLASGTLYAILALREADRRIEKLSQELTAQSRRLLHLESAAASFPAEAAAALARDVETLSRVTTSLAEALGGHDERLGALEQAEPGAAFPPQPAPPPEFAAPPPAPDMPEAMLEPRLATREDFAMAASAILGRLSAEPLRVVHQPVDDAVVSEVEAERVELWLQPVVTLPQRHVRSYLARPHVQAAEGAHFGPDVIRPILARRRRIERLDALAFARALVVAARLAESGRDTAIVLRLSREALGNPAFIEGAAGRLGGDPAAAERLVIDVPFAEAETLSALEIDALARLRSCGARLSVSEAPSLDLDWAALGRRGYSQVGLDAAAILAPRPHATTAFLVAEAARAGLALVAGGVDRESLIPDLLDFDVPFAVGPALAPARPVRADLVSADTARPKAEAPAPPADGRTSFRDFLRRAG